jgi:uncharacterized membrane protein YbhN (UPF0104 family)
VIPAWTNASGLRASSALAAVLAYRVVNFWLVLLGGWITMVGAGYGRAEGKTRSGN